MRSVLVAAIFILGLAHSATAQQNNIAVSVDKLDYPFSDIRLVYAQRFELETPAPFFWQQEESEINTGTFIIAKTDPNYIFPRNTLEPVLYAGNQTVQRLNQGPTTDTVVGIIPGDISPEETVLWFGQPALPERLSRKVIDELFDRALASGLMEVSSQIEDAEFGDAVTAVDLYTYLRDTGAEAVLRFAPEQKQLAETWRLPVLGEK